MGTVGLNLYLKRMEVLFDEDEQMPSAFKHILNSKKVILSPHVGGWTKAGTMALEKVMPRRATAAEKLNKNLLMSKEAKFYLRIV